MFHRTATLVRHAGKPSFPALQVLAASPLSRSYSKLPPSKTASRKKSEIPAALCPAGSAQVVFHRGANCKEMDVSER